jgi:hypothetical protein
VPLYNNYCLFTPLSTYASTRLYFPFLPFMPKLIDYPRTNYTGAWEVAEVVDDTGGKCALETCARKLNRKVSGSFKAIVGSGVKFGLLTSKREILTTTTLFRRIKHAYDKQEELIFHREAFLTPPLFTQLCRKFRSRELPVAMLDVLLIREFSVEEINAQSVAKAFIDGARMVGILNEDNIVADIDQLAAQQSPRRELANPAPAGNVFRQSPAPVIPNTDDEDDTAENNTASDEPEATKYLSPPSEPPKEAPKPTTAPRMPLPASRPAPAATTDAIAHLFGFNTTDSSTTTPSPLATPATTSPASKEAEVTNSRSVYVPETKATGPTPIPPLVQTDTPTGLLFRIQLAGPGLNTQLDVVDVEDLALVRALLDKIERQLKK